MFFSSRNWLQQLFLQIHRQRIRRAELTTPRRRNLAARSRYPSVERFEDRTLLSSAPLVSIGDASLTEGDAGTTSLTFTLTRTGDTSSSIRINYSTADNSATAGSDYVAVSGSVTMLSGVTTATIDVPLTGDALIEANESFFVNLTSIVELDGADGTFIARQDYDSDSGPRSVSIGDINGDGKPDVVIANISGSNVAVYLNTTPTGSGASSFTAKQSFTVGNKASSVMMGDLNNDGQLDLAVANFESNDVSVLLNTTVTGSLTATFSASVQFPTGTGPNAVALADFNNDGKLDLSVANRSAGSVSVLLNQTAQGAATPSFSPKFDFTVANLPDTLTIADLNTDGHPDIITANAAVNTISVLLNTTLDGSTTPTFRSHQDLTSFTGANSIAADDINGDGLVDLAVANSGANTVSVLLNTTAIGGTAFSFTNRHDYPVGTAPWSVSLRDLNADGTPDLAVANHDSNSISVLFNQTAQNALTSSFATQLESSAGAGAGPAQVITGDLNGDNTPDLLSVNLSGTTFSVFLNAPASPPPGSTFNEPLALTVAESSSGEGVAGDFNGDGQPDLISARGIDTTISIFVNSTIPGSGTATFQPRQTMDLGDVTSSLGAADVNLDGKLDLVFFTSLPSTVSVMLNTTLTGATTLTFAPRQEFVLDGSNPVAFKLGDLNADGLADLVFGKSASGVVTVYRNTTSPGAMTVTFAAPLDLAIAGRMSDVAIGDLNADGRMDLAFADDFNGKVSVLLNTSPTPGGALSFASRVEFDVQALPTAIAIGDLNSDGKPDLAVSSVFAVTAVVLLNTTPALSATPTFAARQDFSEPNAIVTRMIVLEDFNGDGRVDFAAMHDSTGRLSVFNNTTAAGSSTVSFATRQVYRTSSAGYNLMPGDFNLDGRLDVAVGQFTSADIQVFVNSGAAFADSQGMGTLLNDDFGAKTSIDLNGSDTPGLTYSASFVEGSPPVAIADADATLTDDDNTELLSLTLVVSAVPDGAKESLTAGTLLIPLNANRTGTTLAGSSTFQVTYLASTRTLTVTKNGGGTAPIDDFQSLLRSIVYNNTSDAPNTVPRTVNITANDGLSTGAASVSTITITPTNDQPTDINLTGSTTAENVPIGTTIGTFSTVDPDAGNSFTYTLIAGPGSTDNGSFNIVNGQLQTTGNLDFDSKPSYSIRVRSTDQGNLSVDKQFTITVTNVNEAPTDITLPSTSVTENVPVGTTIGTFSSIDPDVNNTFTYLLVTGPGSTHNSAFTIVNGQLRTAMAINFEAQSSYAIRVRSTDQGGQSFEKQFTITVNDANDPPSDITLSPASVAENQVSGTVVGTFTSTDPDLGNSFTYTLVPGIGSTDNNSFSITNGQLVTTASFNFETKNSYSIRVRSTDQGSQFVEKQLTITVTDANDAPVDMLLSAASISENVASGAFVGFFSSTDPDAGDSFTYSFATGPGSTHNSSFSISNGQLLTATSFDFENQPVYSIRIRTTDQNGLTFEKPFTITVTNVNEAPADITLTVTAIAENQPGGSPVGNFTTTDPDALNLFAYTLVGGPGSTDNDNFNILNNQLRAGSTFDFEFRNSYSIRVRSTDQGGLTIEKQFTVTVTDINEAPTAILLSPAVVAENQLAGTVVGTLSSTDPDPSNTFLYTFATGNGSTDNGSFTILNGQLRTAASFNFEAKNSYSIRVRSTDQGGLSFDQQLTVAVSNVNEPPTAITLSPSAVSENQPADTLVGSLNSADPDANSTFTYTLVTGSGSNDNGSFTITNHQLFASPTLDYETKNAYTIRIRSTDQNGLTFDKILTINVNDVNEVPVILANQSFTIAENSQPGTAVDRVLANDPDVTSPFNTRNFSITGGNPGNAFAIDPNTGQLTVNNSAALDFEISPVFHLEISLVDGGGAAAVPTMVSVHLVDLNESPTLSSISPQLLGEDAVSGALALTIGDAETLPENLIVQATSSNPGLVSNANLHVSGTGANRNLVIQPHADQVGTSTITVTVSDGTNSTARSFVLTVLAINDAPTLTSFSPLTIQEDTSTAPLAFTVGDVDNALSGLTVTVASSNQLLVPDANIVLTGSGANRTLVATPLTNRSGTTLITLTISDGTLSTSQEFLLTVEAVDDAPVITINAQPLAYRIGSKQIVAIDGAATVTDVDTLHLDFSSAALKVSGQSARDRLSFLKQAGIARKGKSVRFNGELIGTFTGGKKGIPLTVTLNSFATQSAVQSLVRAIGFKSIDKVSGERTLKFELTNINGINAIPGAREVDISS